MRVILGGGLSGLSAAHYLLHHNPNTAVTVVEASNRVGGWVCSTKHPEGFIFERGPRTIRPRGPSGTNTLRLIEQIGLSDKVIPISRFHPAALNRMIYVNKQLHVLPSSLADIFKIKTPFSQPLINFILNDLKAPSKKIPEHDEPVYDFIERRFSKELADYAVSSMICGICAGDAKEISVKFILKSIFEKEQKHGGVIKGLIKEMIIGWFKRKNGKTEIERSELVKKMMKEHWSVYSIEDGLETLPKTLSETITKKGANIELNSRCSDIYFENENSAILRIDNREVKATNVISSLPANQLAPLIEKHHPKLATELKSIPTVTVAVVNIHYKGKLLKEDGFGFLVPPLENLPILGVIFDSCCFPCEENTVLTAMMGGKWFEKYFGKNPHPDELYNVAVKHIEEILDIKQKPSLYNVNILKDCIPQYTVGHDDRVERIFGYIKHHKLPLFLCGSSYHGVGVNDVIMSAKKAVETLVAK